VEWMPKISIITPSYNQGKFLEKTILSVLGQNYHELEYIIIDGGSTDDSVDIIEKYSKYLKYWISEKDKGQTHAINKGLKIATGDIIGWINSDDFYEKETLHKIANLYKSNGFDLVSGSCTMVDEKYSTIQKLETPQINFNTLLKYWKPHFCPPQPSIFFRKEVFQALGYLDQSLHFGMDYDYWLKAAQQFKFTTIPDNLSYYLVHNESKTGSDIGFHRFVPEWKMIIKRELKQQPLNVRLNYNLAHLAHKLSSLVKIPQ
jgi:glycosyltransferase involved in cell wall biosynthesis